MKKAQLKRGFFVLALIILVIVIGIILITNKKIIKTQERSICAIEEPFTCKELKISTTSDYSKNYILLNAKDLQDVRIIPQSINIQKCSNAIIDKNTFEDSQKKQVRILLDCSPGSKDEKIIGSLELLYRLTDNSVKKTKIDFGASRIN